MGTLVTETPAASSDVALGHFEGMLAFETDCWDVHESLIHLPGPTLSRLVTRASRSPMSLEALIVRGGSRMDEPAYHAPRHSYLPRPFPAVGGQAAEKW